MPPTWNNYRYNPFRSSLRNGSVFRATLCVLVFFGILQWSNLATNKSPGAAGSLRDRVRWSLPKSPLHKDNSVGSGIPPIVQKPSRGRVVVTGGGGNIGKHIVQRLRASGTPVTVLDKIAYQDELNSLSPCSYQHPEYRCALLTVHIGDIRNATLLSEVITPDVVGVIHLAAVSRVLWCLENEADCWDVNERGTQVVLDALTDLNGKDKGKRWFILASSREVYGNPPHSDDRPTTEDAERRPANVYGASKLAAENVVTKHLAALKARKVPGTLRVIALRLSNVYGGVYDHLERLIPSITTQALSHQAIQISGGQQNLDLVHIDDCVEAFLLAVSRLTKSLFSWTPAAITFSSRAEFEAFNVASGESAKVSSAVSTLVQLTHSQSPIQIIPGDSRFPNVYKGSTVKANTVLGFKAKVGVKEGLRRFVEAYMERTSAFLEERIRTSCRARTRPTFIGEWTPAAGTTTATTTVSATPTASGYVSTPEPPEVVHDPPYAFDNGQLDKLHGCTVHVVMNIDGELATLGPPPEHQSGTWTAMRDMPPFLFHTETSRSRAHDGKEKPLLIRIADHDHYYVGLRNSSLVGPVTLERIAGYEIEHHSNNGGFEAGGDPQRRGLITDWEVHADGESSTVRLFIPGTNLQLFPTFIGGNFMIVESSTAEDASGQHGPGSFRITPLCCPSPDPWPFVADDPIDFTIEYQRTSLERPFLGSPAKALCSRLRRALHKIKAGVASLPPAEPSYSPFHLEPDIDQAPRRNLSSHITDWAKAGLPACSNICDHPTICVDTGDCQCVLSSCAPRARFPFSAFANLPILSYPPPSTSSPSSTAVERRQERRKEKQSLVNMVKRSSWKNVLRPQASRLVSVNASLAQIHVAPVSESDRLFHENWRDDEDQTKEIGALRKMHCMSADDQMEKALARMHVTPENAEMTFVRHYQGRRNGDNRLDGTYDYARKNTPGFDPSRVVVPFTHDWGQCLAFEWAVWALRKSVGLRVDPVVRSSTAWSVMGDLNSPCYRPHQDVVIPPRTCLSQELWQSFEDMSNVRPARDRAVLATFKGTPWGTGSLNRARLQCSRHEKWRTVIPGGRLHSDGPVLTTLWGVMGDYDYMGLLNDTIFCPQPAGTTGWSTRLSDSIYAGCIPVLIGEASHYPFFDVIDWNKISVRVNINDLSHLEEVLLSRYTLEDIERLQTNVMLVRNAFVYPLDDVTEEDAQRHMLEERGPLFFALQSTKLKLLTKWPMTDAYDRP